MGVVNNLISDRFIPKEQIPFYVETMKLITYSCDPMKTRSESEIVLPIKHRDDEFELTIKNYKYGIFEILIDLPDKSLKYKNKTNIGAKLQPKKFTSILNENGKISLTTEDDSENGKSEINKYKLMIDLQSLEVNYYINDNLIINFNKRKTIKSVYDIDKNLKSNIFDMTMNDINQCYGLPERSQALFIRDGVIRLYNSDNAHQVAGSTEPTYGSIPMLHGVNKKYTVTVFNNNSSDQYVEIKTINDGKDKDISWCMEGGIIDLYISSDSDYYRNHQKIAEITGYSIMPPLWALGYHQCRYGYRDCNDIMDVEKKFNELNIPIDCFWFDIEHTDQKKYFTWNPKTFNNAKELLEKINKDHRYFVTIIDPHIKVDENYSICQKLKEGDCFVKAKNEKGEMINFIGKCWPGKSYWVDFINYEKILTYYQEFYKNEEYFHNLYNLGTCVNMNEPSIFDENTMPKSNIHNDGNQDVEHKEIHNVYGHFYQKVVYEALKSRLGENKRAFVLSRSFYAGSQQNGFIWTGDQRSNFDFFNTSIETNMINSLCGISGTGSDVGGFLGDSSPELMKAWYSLGPFYAFFRGHSDIGTIRREPWLFEKSICDSMIDSIKLRYHLLMYVYTKYYEHVKNGVPLLKPMWMRFRNNYEDFIDNKDQGSLFIFGEEIIGCNHYTITNGDIDILINKIYTPIYDLITGNKIDISFQKDESKLVQPLAIGGSIISWTAQIEKCSFYVRSLPLSIKIFVDENKCASGHYYFDDGISIDNKGIYIYIEFELKDKIIKVMNKNDFEGFDKSEIFDIAPIYDKVEIYGFGKISSTKLNSNDLAFTYNEKNNSIVIDLFAEKIKINKSLEISLDI